MNPPLPRPQSFFRDRAGFRAAKAAYRIAGCPARVATSETGGGKPLPASVQEPASTKPALADIGGTPPLPPDLPSGGDGGGDSDSRVPQPDNSRGSAMTGIVVTMIASTMTFASFVSAMVIRRGLGLDWHHVGLPALLWWNTGALVASSIAIDVARRLLRRGRRQTFNRLWTLGTLLGTIFLVGQGIAWKQLADRGYYLAGNPASAFFYVTTWTHAAHVVAALAAVGYVEYRALRSELDLRFRTWVDVSAVFWHFLDVMWLGIMALFVFWA